MLQGQIKPEHGETPGMVGKYEVAENWRADGEHFYTFDYDSSLVGRGVLYIEITFLTMSLE